MLGTTGCASQEVTSLDCFLVDGKFLCGRSSTKMDLVHVIENQEQVLRAHDIRVGLVGLGVGFTVVGHQDKECHSEWWTLIHGERGRRGLYWGLYCSMRLL